MSKLAIASVHKDSSTAGLSPNNNLRTEVFLAGCSLGLRGHPCPDCFNSDLWDPQWFPQVEVEDLVDDIKKIGNPFVTIVGGEPLDQYEELVELLDRLWIEDVHTVVITHYTMEEIKKKYPKVLDFAQCIIDGPYNKSLRTFDECKRPGIYQVIGSSNQRLWYFDWDACEWTEACKANDKEIETAYGVYGWGERV